MAEWHALILQLLISETSFLILHLTLQAKLRNDFKDPYPIILKVLNYQGMGKGGGGGVKISARVSAYLGFKPNPITNLIYSISTFRSADHYNVRNYEISEITEYQECN